MATRRTFTPLAAAFAASLPLSLAMAAGLPIGDEPQPSGAAAANPQAAIQQAERLLAEGKPVAARALLIRTLDTQGDGVIRTESWRTQAMELLSRAGKQIRETEPNALSIQKAEVALTDGDVRLAERHLQAVLKSATLTPSQESQARALLGKLGARRQELGTIVPEALAQAERDFNAGNYAQARAGFSLVDRSGAALTPAQQATLDRYQLKLIQMADSRPDVFSGAASPGLMQPGVLKKRDEQPPSNTPSAPPPAPPPAPPGEQPTSPPPQPEAAPAPVALPSQPQPAPAGQPDNDLIRQARRAEAQSMLLEADRLFDQGRYQSAQSSYQRVLREYADGLTAEETRHAQDRINQARVRAGAAQPPSIEQALMDQSIAKQQAVAEFNSFMEQARRNLASGGISDARNAAAQARLRINTARHLFSEPEFETYNTQVNTLLADVDKRALELEEAARRDRDAQLQDQERRMQTTIRQERDRRIVELIDRARAYQSEKRYAEALQTVDQLLFVDPLNPTGLLLRDVYTDILIYEQSNDIYQRKHVNLARLALDAEEGTVPPPNMMNYPTDWRAISFRRGEPAQFAETPENRAVLSGLNSARIPSVAFNDNALQDVLQFIHTITQQNVDVDWASLEDAGIQRDTPVSLNLTNVTAKTLLDRVVDKVSGADRSNQADWGVIDGVVTVASRERLNKNTALVIYDVRDLLIDVPDYTDVPRIDLQQALQSSQGGGGGQSPFRDNQNDQNQRVRDIDEKLNELISIITTNVDFDGWQENGGDVGRIQKYGSQATLIITNTPKNHRLISGLLSKLREVRSMQINVETRFLLVNQDWFEQIGFDLDVYFNAKNSQVRALRANDPTIRASDFFNNGALNRSATGAVAPNAPTSTPDGTQLTQGVPARTGWSPIGVTQGSLPLASSIAPSSDWSNAILGGAPALGVAGQFLDDIQVDFLLVATQADRRSVQLTAPKVTFTNGQISNIYVATQIAFISQLQAVVGDSAVGFNPTVAVATEGVTLLVEGTVSADRRYVQMNVDAGVARIDGFGQQPVVAIAGGQLVNSAAAQQFIQLPQVTVTRVRTTVTVPDQGTLLMGGQRLVTEFEVETGVPVLSKIPIINRFFTNRIESKEEQTLLILVKPTILIQNEEEERAFPGLLQSISGGMGG
jgi:type II secretory pathway component GspD/PulD (secretin)/tetratricopeptide (TPR) repeat protein